MRPCVSGSRTKNTAGDVETPEEFFVPAQRPGPAASPSLAEADAGGLWPLPPSSLEPPEGLAHEGGGVQTLGADHILVRRSTLSRTGTKVAPVA